MADKYQLSILLKVLDGFTKPFKEASSQIRKTAENVRQMKQSLSPVEWQVRKVAQGFRVLEKAVERTKQKFAETKEQIEKLKSFSQGLALKGSVGVGVGLSPVLMPAGFEQAMAEISTLTDMSFKDFKKKYQNQILSVAKDLGESPELVAKAMYQAISAGIAPDKAIAFIKEAGKAAIAGVSDIFTAVDALTSIKNAWASFGYTTKQINDWIFTAIKLGKTNFSEIAQSIGQIAGVSATAGVQLKEVLAAMATLTTMGDSTGEAFTGLKYVIESLINPTDQAQKVFEKLGIEVDANTLKEKGLKGTLEYIMNAIREYTDDTAEQKQMLATIFSSIEAFGAVLKLTGEGSQKFNNALKEMNTSAGATEKAFKKMSQSLSFHLRQLKASLQVLVITIGSVLIPAFKKVVDALNMVLSPIKTLAEKFPTLTGILLGGFVAFSALVAILGFLGMALSWVLNGLLFWRTIAALITTQNLALSVSLRAITFGFLNIARTGIVTAIGAIRAFSIALLTTPVGWFLLAVTAIAGVGYLIYKKWGAITSFFKNLWNKVKSIFAAFGNWIRAHVKGFWEVFKWTPIGVVIQGFLKLKNFLSKFNLFEAGRKIVTTLWEGIKSVAKKPIEAIKGVVSKIRRFLPFSPAKEGPLKDLHKTGLKLVETIAQSITPTPIIKALTHALRLPFAVGLNKAPIPATASAGVVINANLTFNIAGKMTEHEVKQIAGITEEELRKLLKRIFKQPRWYVD
jgi:TP901 family phage tail tape measure protein